jgi:hypothetical protein
LGAAGLLFWDLRFWEKGADDERETERDEDAFDEKDGVVTPAEDGEGDDDAPHIDLTKKGSEPFGLDGRCRDSRYEREEEAGDFGAVGKAGFAEFSDEERFFAGDETELEEKDSHDTEDGSAGRHEECKRKGVEKRAEVERIAKMAVRAGCDDAFAMHSGVLNDRRAEVSGGPGAEECSL